MRAERITDRISYHGEGAVWWPTLDRLRMVDMLAGDVLTVDVLGDPRAQGGVVRHATGSKVAAVVRPRAGGGAVVAVERGIALASKDDLSDLDVQPEVFSDKAIRMNEGGCDPAGRFWCGTMAYDQAEGAAILYRFDEAGVAVPVVTDATIANGFGFSPDRATAYWIDTPTGEVFAFDWDEHLGLTNRRTFTKVDPDHGHPDGLTVDAEGGVWVAIHSGGRVHRYDAAGRLSEVVELDGDAKQVTSCALGGPGLSTLYITTSRENLPDDEQPDAGSLFAVEVGVAGLPPLPCSL